ncbi:MAG: hypothetical protein LBS85_05105 [Clostridiales Family XIII bacterium]|jgi:hypothetical protein|nr:hypothetical protein [Clostridiales Family XIII bacterium]
MIHFPADRHFGHANILGDLFFRNSIPADELSYRDNRLFLNYVGLKRISDGFADGDPLPKAVIAAHSHIDSRLNIIFIAQNPAQIGNDL